MVARACAASSLPFYVSRLGAGINPALEEFGGDSFELGEVGKRINALTAAGCDAVTMIGNLGRPDFKSIKVDARGAMMLPKVVMAARKGDDALLSVIVSEFERAGFRVLGVQDVSKQLLAPAGLIAGPPLSDDDHADMKKAAQIASAIGALDVGQGCVVCHGLVLAVEAQEGTDAMLRRVAELPERLRGTAEARAGVIAKIPKPQQEMRVDLPTIGTTTIRGAANAGLKAVAFQAGSSLLLERDACIALANEFAVSIYGFTADELSA